MVYSARPDGTAITQPYAVCDAGQPICPRCGNVFMGRVTAQPDVLLITCTNRHRPAPGPREQCGQHAAMVSMVGGLVLVVAVTDDQFAKMRGTVRPVRDSLRDLGIIVGKVA